MGKSRLLGWCCWQGLLYLWVFLILSMNASNLALFAFIPSHTRSLPPTLSKLVLHNLHCNFHKCMPFPAGRHQK